MNVKAIVFDYGNTLVIDPFDSVLSLKANDLIGVMRKKGYEISKKRLTEVWSKVNTEVNYPFCSHFAQEIPLIETTLEILGVKGGRRQIAQQLLVVYREGLRQVLKKDKMVSVVKEVLSGLKSKGKKLYVLSNETTDTLRMQLSWTGMAEFFDDVISSQRVGFDKPDHRIFNYIFNIANTSWENMLYVGDDPERDIKPSKELGMKAVMLELPKSMAAESWRNYNFRLKGNEKPDHVIKDFRELLEIIE